MAINWYFLSSVESGEDAVKNVCRLMTEFGNTFPNYVAKHLTHPDIVIYLETMLTFTGFPGYYTQDQEISFVFIFSIVLILIKWNL